MPVTIFYSFRYAIRTLAVGIFMFAIASFAPSAYADPHAVFYTDRAQEQLFFNTLAALNQADFVEPVIGQYSRDSLTQARTTALPNPSIQFNPETNPLITSTRSQLPSILTRSVTLEGNDMWTAYLVHQFALETATRRSESELARLFCERGLGRIGCDSSPGKAQQQDEAFVTNPIAQAGSIDVAVNAKLSSGTQQEKQVRQEITTNPGNTAVYGIPRPNSPSLAALYQNITDNTWATGLLDSLAGLITTGTGVDPDTFTDVSFDKDGIAHLPKDISSSEYMRKVNQLAKLPSQLVDIAQEGQQEALAFQEYTQNPTAVADYVLERENDSTDGSSGVTGRVIVPSNVKNALAESTVSLLADAVSSQKYTNTNSITQSGNQSLVDSTLSSSPGPVPPGGPLPSFRPIPSPLALNTTPQNGQVAGISSFDQQINQIYTQKYTGPQPVNLSPAVKDESILLEPGILDAIQAITGDGFRRVDAASVTTRSAFSLAIDSLLNSSSVTDVLCSIFPTVKSCLIATLAPTT